MKGKERGKRMGRKSHRQQLSFQAEARRDPAHIFPSSHLYTSIQEAPWILEAHSLYRYHGRGPTCHTRPQMAWAEAPPPKAVPPPSWKPPYQSQRGMSACLTRCCPARGWWMQIDSI